MKLNTWFLVPSLFAVLALASVAPREGAVARGSEVRVLFLHHSTGGCIWDGGVPEWFANHNSRHGTSFRVTEREFPKDSPYGWENYPFDYWNIWVKHAGPRPYREEPTLEILSKDHDLIVWKHCFPVSAVDEDTGHADVASSEKRAENYKLQYAALKKKMLEFPRIRFLVWTGPALGAAETDAQAAKRADAFFAWVRQRWDTKGDNIYLWDFRALETDGGLYLKRQYATGPEDSHPNESFSRMVAPLLGRRIVAVATGHGDETSLTGR